MRCAYLTLPFLFVCVVACGVDGPGSLPYPYGGGASDGGGDGGSGAASSSSSSSSSSGSGSTSSTTGSTSSAATGASTSASTGTGGGGYCNPEAGDPECVVCAKENCCSEIQACAGDQDCVCWFDCVLQSGGAVEQCIGQCGAPSDAMLAVFDCASVSCQAECGNIGI